jgi:acyl carrier protein
MDREQLRQALVDLIEQETWERPEDFRDHVRIREGLKLDSVDLLSVMLKAESQLGVSLDSRDFDRITTVGDLLATIERKMSTRAAGKAA